MSRGGIAANIAKLPERLLGLETPRSRLNCENPRMAVSGRHRRSMQPRFIHHRQSTWCQLPSTQLQWCRAITQRPWFRSQYMPTPQGIGVATGMGGAATASSQYMPTPRGIGVATGMGGAATATGMGGAKHLTRNDTGAELVAT